MKKILFAFLFFAFTFSFGQIPSEITKAAKDDAVIGQLNHSGKIHYIVLKYNMLSQNDVVASVNLLTLEADGKVSDTALQKPLVIEYVQKPGLVPIIHFDEKKSVLLVPRVVDDQLSFDFLEYTFNGQYFECREFENALDEVMLTLKDSSLHNVVNPQTVLIKDKEMALAIAEPILFDLYGKGNILQQKPYDIQYVEVYWVISGTLKEGWLGGTFLIIMDSRNAQILRITHGK